LRRTFGSFPGISIDKSIRRNVDRLAAGDLELFHFSDADRKKAKERLETARAAMMARYNRVKRKQPA